MNWFKKDYDDWDVEEIHSKINIISLIAIITVIILFSVGIAFLIYK